jgi:hypothetical protein
MEQRLWRKRAKIGNKQKNPRAGARSKANLKEEIFAQPEAT